MLRPVIGLFLLISVSTVQAAPKWSGGLGYEARVQREVNPDFSETKGLPQVFAQMLFVNWIAHVEAGTEQDSSNSGALKITTRSHHFGVWGRYSFLQAKRWRPFASAGVGTFIDNVKSEFGDADNDSRGTRPFLGTGGGVTTVFWEHLLFEGEARATLVRERKEPMISALLRVGFLF